MNKRLEDIKNSDYSILKVDSDLKRDWEWLIEQAERADKNAQDLEDMDRQLYREQQQNKRYREALKKIEILWKNATESTDDRQLTWLMYSEAQKALEGEK